MLKSQSTNIRRVIFFFTEMTLARMIYFDAVFDIDVRSVKYGRTPLLPLPPPSPDAR